MPTSWISGCEARLWRKPWTWPWTRPTMATRMGGGVWAAALFCVRLEAKRLAARRSLARLIGLGTSVMRRGWARWAGAVAPSRDAHLSAMRLREDGAPGCFRCTLVKRPKRDRSFLRG